MLIARGRGSNLFCEILYRNKPYAGGSHSLLLSCMHYFSDRLLGETYATMEKTDLAIQNYEKVMEIDPSNKHAEKMLQKIKGENL